MVASPLRRLLTCHPLAGPGLLALGLLAGLWAGWSWFLNRPTGHTPERVTVEAGMNARNIGLLLEEKELVRSGNLFAVMARLRGLEGRLQAGTYRLDGHRTTAGMVEDLLQSPIQTARVTIPEGLTRHEVAGLLDRAGVVDSASFVAATGDRDLVHRLGVEASTLEGYLFPETYVLAQGSGAEEVARTMVAQFGEVMAPHLRSRLSAIGLTLHQAVTLASIVEREAQVQTERPVIAGVFLRRLRLAHKLESCATVEFALGVHKDHLSNVDIQVESPYNTYRYPGLPPGPIANPGRAALAATLFPVDTEFLFFVARGDGTHIFSHTRQEHERAKQKVRQLARRDGR